MIIMFVVRLNRYVAQARDAEKILGKKLGTY